MSLWTFSAQQLEEKRTTINARAAEQSKRGWKEEGVVNPKSKPLSAKEEAFIRRHFETAILHISQKFKFPMDIQAVAVIFFKRFYLLHSIMDYEPSLILLACMLLACKTEEAHIRPSELARSGQQELEHVIHFEPVVLRGLEYDLFANHAFRPLRGHVANMKKLGLDVCVERDSVTHDLGKLAYQELVRTLRTDACFLFPPTQLALAVLKRRAEAVDAAGVVEEYIEKQFGDSMQLEQLSGNLQNVCDYLQQQEHANAQFDKVTPEQKKKISRKMFRCSNPYANPKSEEYKIVQHAAQKRQEQEALRQSQERHQQRQLQLQALLQPDSAPSAMDDDDDFVLHTRTEPHPAKRSRVE